MFEKWMNEMHKNTKLTSVLRRTFAFRPGRFPQLIGFCFNAAIISLLLLTNSCSKKKSAAEPDAVSGPIRVEARRVAASKAKTPADISPYDDAIAWHEYEILRVISGDIEGAKSIRVAHWTVRRGKVVPQGNSIGETVTLLLRPFERVMEFRNVATSDDLDLSTATQPEFYDLAWEIAEKAKPENQRLDYGGAASDEMKLYWKLRPQLKLVVIGNSQAQHGICPHSFFAPENRTTPVALNFATAGSYNAQHCLMVRDYVLPLPNLEWVVWVVSARSFNARWSSDTRKFHDFLESAGHRYDVQHKAALWPVPPSEKLITTKELEKNVDRDNTDVYGWVGRAKTMLPKDLAAARADLLKEFSTPFFIFSDEAWAEFENTVHLLSARGVRVLLLTVPLHPISADTPALDTSGSSHEGQLEMVRRARALASGTSHIWFRDFHNDGHHDFAHEDFYDAGHLRISGAYKLSERIAQWMATCAKEESK